MSAPNRRAFWLDVRFLIGLMLVVASVAGVWLVISSARQTAPVLVAAHTVLPGETVTSDDVRVAEVALGQLTGGYLSDGALGADGVDAGMVATRTIVEGELLHTTALADARTVSTTVVVVRSAVDVPSTVVAGTTVDLWVAPVDADGVPGKPRILVAGAVVSVVDRSDGFVGSRGQSVELIIPRADVAAALEALSAEATLSVVPTGATP